MVRPINAATLEGVASTWDVARGISTMFFMGEVEIGAVRDPWNLIRFISA
jgi:hypothetical protein